jgi:hypothetical protein
VQVARHHRSEQTVLCMTQSPYAYLHNNSLNTNVTCSLLFCLHPVGRKSELKSRSGWISWIIATTKKADSFLGT